MKGLYFNFFSVVLVLPILVKQSASTTIEEQLVSAIGYKLQGKLHSKQTGYHGDSLVVGTAPDIQFENGKKGIIYSCVKQEEAGTELYKEDYRTSIMKRSTKSYEINEDEQRQRNFVQWSDYFVYITRAVFMCTHVQETTGKKQRENQVNIVEVENISRNKTCHNKFWLTIVSVEGFMGEEAKLHSQLFQLPNFLGIVNVLMSVKEIFEVKFYDGVKVLSVNHLGDERRVKITETKYLFENTTGSYWMTYEGEFSEDSQHTDTDSLTFIPNINTVHRTCSCNQATGQTDACTLGCFTGWRRSSDGHFKECLSCNKGTKTIRISNSGKSVKIGYDASEVSQNYKGVFQCRIQQGMNPLPQNFWPECYQKVQDENSDNIFAVITDKEFSKFFTLVKSEVWHCKNEEDSFLRVVTEMIGRVQIENLYYRSGITYLYSIKIASNGLSIRFKEIRYFDYDTMELGEGDVKLDLIEPEKLRSTQTKSRELDMNFALASSAVYKTLIGSEGYDLRVGSKTQTTIRSPPDYDIFQCFLAPQYNSMPELRTIFKIKLHEDDVIHRVQKIEDKKESKYYRYISRETWRCRGYKEITFLRIVNKIEVLIPVREIETVDGVEIFYTLLANNKKSVNIVETKYVQKSTLKHVLYVGRVQLVPGDTFRASDYAIIKSTDETVPLVGHSLERIVFARDVNSDWKPDKYNILSIGTGNDVIKYNFNPSINMTDSNDIFECVCSKPDSEKLYPSLQILDKNTNNLKEEANTEEKRTKMEEKYFENVERDQWICTNTKKDESFRRIVTRNVLKHSALAEVGEIQSTDLDKAWIELEGTQYVVKMSEIRYLQPSDHRLINYYGRLVYEDKTPKFGQWQSGTIKFTNYNDNPLRDSDYYETEKEANYNLDRERKYECYFYPTGDILEIGSKWQRVFGTKDLKISCQIHNEVDDAYRPHVFRLEKNGEKTYNGILEEYFVNLKQEIWNCTGGGNNILRVLNQLTVKKKEVKDMKSLFHYDGVTVLSGDSLEIQDEIIEVKYLDPSDATVLKFEGKVELTGTLGGIGIGETLRDGEGKLEKRDSHVPLNDNEVFKTDINREGIILEVGHKSEMDIRSLLQCTKNENVDEAKVNQLIPRVVIFFSNEVNDFVSITLINSTVIGEYFEFTQDSWNCEDEYSRFFTRVVNKLRLKQNHQVAHIYHHNDVNINLDDGVFIEEIKFFDKDMKHRTMHYGVTLFSEQMKDLSHFHMLGKPFREIDYLLDTKSVYLANPSLNGGTIKVGTHWQKVFNNYNNEVVTCRRKEYEALFDAFVTTVYTDLVTSSTETGNSGNNGKKDQDLFEAVDQDVWQCSINEQIVFYRVINKLFISREMARIYYNDGVSIRKLTFPGLSTGIQITELKYVEPVTNTTLKYDGKLKIEANNLVERLIQIPTEDADKNLIPLTYNPTKDIQNLNKINHLTLDALRVHLLRKKSEVSGGVITGVAYSKKPLTTFFTGSGYRRFRVGRQWDRALKTTDGEMQCLLDEWNVPVRLRYVPTVMEYLDENLYELDEDALMDVFVIDKQEVWVCSNGQDSFLRVMTVLRGKIPIYSIRQYEGVLVEKFELVAGNDVYSVLITETVYIDIKTSKLLKYEGNLQRKLTAAGMALENVDFVIKKSNNIIGKISHGVKGAFHKFRHNKQHKHNK